jgi:D-alanine-D-alanine ligase
VLNPLNVLLLYGGKSGEHEVSLASAASVLAHLDAEKYRIIPVAIDKEGRYFLNDYQDLLTYKGALPVLTPSSQPLESLLANGRLAVDADVVFPVLHGPPYEDGCLQGLLELANVAYVGCGVLSSALGMDKDMARRVVAALGVHAARYQVLSHHLSVEETTRLCQQTAEAFGWPLFVKPCTLGSSVGIHKAHHMAELLAAVADAWRYDDEILIEENIQGREIELAVLEDLSPLAPPKVSVAGEICVHHPDGFYSYAAKYLESEQTELIAPACLNESLLVQLQQISAEIFRGLKCKGMARVDFFVNEADNKIYFNEINTLPGFTPISMYPRLWQASGLAYGTLLDYLIRLAITRYQSRAQLVRHYM